MSKIVVTLSVVFILSIISLVCLAQPANLTDRELLIQLFSKMETIENSVSRIENSFTGIKGNTQQLDVRVTRNEINIDSFYERLKDLIVRWNTLLGLFVTFILGIFVWMWRSVYYRRHPAFNQSDKGH